MMSATMGSTIRLRVANLRAASSRRTRASRSAASASPTGGASTDGGGILRLKMFLTGVTSLRLQCLHNLEEIVNDLSRLLALGHDELQLLLKFGARIIRGCERLLPDVDLRDDLGESRIAVLT